MRIRSRSHSRQRFRSSLDRCASSSRHFGPRWRVPRADDLERVAHRDVIARRGSTPAFNRRSVRQYRSAICSARELCALGEVAALILAALAQKRTHAFDPKPVELVDGAQHGEAFSAFAIAAEPIASSTPSSTLRLLTLTTYWPRGTPSASSVSAASMQSSASAATRRGADRVGVELGELAEAARPRLLVAPHRARPDSGGTAWAGSGNSRRRSGRAARSGRSAATAIARRRP